MEMLRLGLAPLDSVLEGLDSVLEGTIGMLKAALRFQCCDEHGLQLTSMLAMSSTNRNIFPVGLGVQKPATRPCCALAALPKRQLRCTVGEHHKHTDPSSP
jgi:hypothetical protein